MTIGAALGPSILVIPALTARTAGPAAIIAWMLMSVVNLALSLTIGRTGAHVPHAGGLVAFTRSAFGEGPARIAGWWLLASVPFTTPIVSLIGTNYVTSFFGLPDSWGTGLAALLLASSFLINARGLRLAGRVQLGLVAAVCTVLILATTLGGLQVRTEAFEPFAPQGWFSVGVAALLIFWSYIGFEMTAYLAEEFRQPKRDLPMSMVIGSVVLSTLYVASAIVTVGSKTYLGSGGAPLSQQVESVLGHAAGAITAIFALLCAFVAAHTNIAAFSRLIQAQAREGKLPQRLARRHPRFKTPTMALGVMACGYYLVLLGDLIFSPDLDDLIVWPSTTFVALYLLGTAAALRILPVGDIGRASAVVAVVACFTALIFSGWSLTYPIGIALIGLAVRAWRRQKVHS